MELGAKTRAIVLVLMLLSGTLVHESTAKSEAKCFAICMIECLIFWHEGFLGCLGLCGTQCTDESASASAPAPAPVSASASLSDYCVFGCATSSCAKHINPSASPATEAAKMEKCVDSCESACGNKHVST
ncbi:hypothetical protein Dimus_004361 [Dionaea muscipula]